jgi:glycosyltransferase involved in cell wall biosynthesis
MNQRPEIVVVMPAYNAARTLQKTYAELPHDVVGRVIVVDDGSSDETVKRSSSTIATTDTAPIRKPVMCRL